jgi:MerR family transcriptional regulator, thiopeptide resistance regulator
MPPTKPTYTPHEFAKMSGVTVRALHHYDRLGLLTPRRTSAGYRVYSERDLEALEQIVVLKFIGIPLRNIAVLRSADAERLAHALRAQRRTLDGKRQLLDQAITAIRELEAMVAGGQAAEPGMFKQIIEVIEMQNNSDAWKREYDDLVRMKIDRLRSLQPDAIAEARAQWNILVGEIREAMTDDPASPKAQELGSRWTHLLATLMGQPVSKAELRTHHDAQEWNPRMASFVDKNVWDFMTRVLAACN